MPKRSLLPFFFLMFIISFSIAQTPIQKLEKAYRAFQADPQTKYAITSLCVLDANTGKPLFTHNEQVGLATASTLKVITAATAFSMLGSDFQFQTTLAYTGNITADGILKGDLVIIGGGDPTLGSDRYLNKENVVLSEWAAAVKKAGIKKIEGAIVGDDRIFGTQTTPEGWIWQDLGNYYGAGTSGLSWRENQFDIHLKPGAKADDEVRILKTVPETSYLKIVNELKTGASGTGDNAYLFLAPYGTTGYLRGTWGIGINKSAISGSLPDPAYDCAYRLQDTLKQVGIIATQPATTTRIMALNNQPIAAITQKISTITSPTLAEISYWFLKKSINLYGENLLKTIAIKSGKVANTNKGAETVINFWADKGIDKNAMNIIDGSGLSPSNRVTSMAIANVLFQAQKESWFGDYYKSFPEYNGMKIKSGTINSVSAFAGYHTSTAGNKYIIVININNYSGSGINNKLFTVLNALK
ncbi:D-alanyl-D-alanine carboxypeptidase/D-alanyl-D-alanine endopeptidase [Pedobacter nyackensis]|uniref:D-alanyl-D-alanine carboxypeptidase / D-alanyl-D-alanine-endopeptidase (Penicillin-binding protein 4) n=1 Tax=Pedobacter nyackensis TaxID=475255 RepID=A0A1W2CAC1_9SPHI|nr:D-alanyl-D-alanine carboxypeptidase/D-alanyl-D-alanine-endopeptidase [Pedobacter nyackensis]SMC82227.1 D-alanyl-D-alanine carboxypeptidase / D-alanyl-D-alanine-endopeptidase (penicillin-binding protein 4) [Pedobacter nyackensis]